jgi:hypothetical protein
MGIKELVKMRNSENFDNYWNSEGHKAILVISYTAINIFLYCLWMGSASGC